jgi:CheY-like chemotaxis protein
MPKKILLADDSITIQKVVELTFSDGDYEVTAVNNGAKAIQKLAEMRPDIILSDIIMPEKNGYEVCEYVKSHPEYRNIPVVLLTGTFEPFDPDRAEKAGCDAVVTKPFESQSLIHKVEELIASAQSGGGSSPAAAAAAPAPPPVDVGSPWMDDTANNPPPPPPRASAFSTASGGFPSAPSTPDSFTHEPDIFASAAPVEATTEMPFEIPSTPSFGGDMPFDDPATPEFAGETRAFPRMTFDEMQKMAAAPEPEPTPEPEPSPWDEPAAFGGETRAFEKMSFEDFQASAPAPEPQNNETRAIQRMSLEELQKLAAADEAAAAAPLAPEPPPPASPWDEPEAPAFGGETRAIPKLSFDDFQQMSAPTPEAPAFGTDAGSPFGSDADAPAFGGETRAFPKLSFDDFQQMTAEPAAAPEPEPEPEPASPFGDDAASPFSAEPVAFEDDLPTTAVWSAPEPEPEPDEAPLGLTDQPMHEDMFASQEPAEEPAWMTDAATAAPEPVEEEPVAAAAPEPAPAPVAAEAAPAAPIASDLTDEQIDKIARRVVELISDQVVRNIAWEVIPDMAEMVVKERIRQLEAEA